MFITVNNTDKEERQFLLFLDMKHPPLQSMFSFLSFSPRSQHVAYGNAEAGIILYTFLGEGGVVGRV